MRGISEKDLLVKLEMLKHHEHDRCLLEVLIDECKELNPRLPIDENTPKNRRLSLYWPGTGWITGRWVQLNNTVGYFTHDLSRYDPPSVKPTHYQELPETPL